MLQKCINCNIYLLHETCKCGKKTKNPHPAKFSIERHKKYSTYRLAANTKLKKG